MLPGSRRRRRCTLLFAVMVVSGCREPRALYRGPVRSRIELVFARSPNSLSAAEIQARALPAGTSAVYRDAADEPSVSHPAVELTTPLDDAVGFRAAAFPALLASKNERMGLYTYVGDTIEFRWIDFEGISAVHRTAYSSAEWAKLPPMKLMPGYEVDVHLKQGTMRVAKLVQDGVSADACDAPCTMRVRAGRLELVGADGNTESVWVGHDSNIHLVRRKRVWAAVLGAPLAVGGGALALLSVGAALLATKSGGSAPSGNGGGGPKDCDCPLLILGSLVGLGVTIGGAALLTFVYVPRESIVVPTLSFPL